MNRAGFMKGQSNIATWDYAWKTTSRTGQGLIYKQDADISSVSANWHFTTILDLKIMWGIKEQTQKAKELSQKSSAIVVKEAYK